MNPELNLEEALRNALRRVEPPAGFAHRVLEKTVQRRRQKALRVWFAMAAMLVIGAFLATAVLQYQSRQEAESRKAGQQLAMALRIAGHKVHAAHQMIRRRNNGA